MLDFRMPALGADMEAGTLTQWLVKPGDAVVRGQIIVQVETEKGIVEVEIWQTGVVEQLVVAPGTKVPVGTVLATLREAGEPRARGIAGAPLAPLPALPFEAPFVEALPAPAVVPKAPAAAARPPASPAARKRARELDVDLAAVAGTGPHGAISVADVEQVASVKAAAAEGAREAEGKEIDRALAMRRAIAAAMARSKREIPHYYVATDIDMSRAQAWLTAENLRRPVSERLLLAVLELKAVALALREVPELNGFWVDGAQRPADAVHLGVAISLRKGGLVAPAIHDVDRRALGELMADLADLTRRARAGTLRSSEMADPTITVTSLGEQGVEVVYGVIHPPQVALVGLGKVTERPWAAGGMLGVRPVLTATLSADHRASDGHRGGLFLAAFSRLLQEPERL
jgi:pyruvate dehydrogenase E2 component (dihydrolipoamide acetyltransferase)